MAQQQRRNSARQKKGYDGSSLDEYVDVAERIQDFLDAHPEGSLQRVGMPRVVTITGFDPKKGQDYTGTFIEYTAAAYRNPEDPRPGIGTAYEPFPGQTPYTKNSELMNAETAAWGRAIIALGLCANRGLASRQEVRARREEQEAADAEPKPKARKKAEAKKEAEQPADSGANAPADAPSVDALRKAATKLGLKADDVRWYLTSLGVEDTSNVKTAMEALSAEDRTGLLAEFEKALAKKAEGDA